MSWLIEDKSRKEELRTKILEILTSDDKSLDEMCWIQTTRRYADIEGAISQYPELDKPITRRMALLSELVRRPYIMELYFTDGPNKTYELDYKNEIITEENMTPEQKILAEKERRRLEELKSQDKLNSQDNGRVRLSRTELDGIVRVDIDIPKSVLLERGIDPAEIGWQSQEELNQENLNKQKQGNITSKIIAEADKEIGLTKTEVTGIRGLFNRIKEFFKGKGEK